MAPTSPTRPLLVGLAITLLAVAVFSWYALSRIEVVRGLQTHTIDRNRQDSLQLLRIQNNFHSLALAMRDMVEGSEPYPLDSWKIQFDRIRFDLEDALNIEARITPIQRRPDQQKQFAVSLLQFWNSADQMFALARAGSAADLRRRGAAYLLVLPSGLHYHLRHQPVPDPRQSRYFRPPGRAVGP